jgi:hypothetical protein
MARYRWKIGMASFLATLALDAARCRICPAAIPRAVAAFFGV